MFSARTSDVAQGGALTRGFRHSHRAASSASQTIAWRWPSWRLPAARAQQSCQPETVCPEHSSLPYCNARLSLKTITAAQKTIDNQLQTNKYFRILIVCRTHGPSFVPSLGIILTRAAHPASWPRASRWASRWASRRWARRILSLGFCTVCRHTSIFRHDPLQLRPVTLRHPRALLRGSVVSAFLASLPPLVSRRIPRVSGGFCLKKRPIVAQSGGTSASCSCSLRSCCFITVVSPPRSASRARAVLRSRSPTSSRGSQRTEKL